MNEEYKKLVRHILYTGVEQKGRNGSTLIIPSYSFTVQDMENGHTLKLRKMYYKGILGEFLTLVDSTPLTNVKQFEKNGCNYWSEWADENGDLNLDYHNQMHPQLGDVIRQIKKDPSSRRHVISLWNHKTVDTLSLPCCWHSLTFSVIDKTLHLTWTQRSVDTMVGLPSDIYLAYLFMNYVAEHTKLRVGSCMFSLSNVHIYGTHIDSAIELLERSDEYSDIPLKFKVIT